VYSQKNTQLKRRFGKSVSLEGHIEEHHRFTLSLAYEQYKIFAEQLDRIEEKMLEICQTHYSREMELLKKYSRSKYRSCHANISETAADMSAFENSGKLTGWTGLRPRNDESAGKYKSTAITKGNKYLRRIMVQVAWAAARTKNSHYP